MVLEWDDWGWESVDGGMRLRGSKEHNDHRIVCCFGTRVKTGVLSISNSKTEYSHANSYHITVMETSKGDIYLVWLRKEVDDGA